MASQRPHWIAGPIGYDHHEVHETGEIVSVQWLFVGGAPKMVRRWALNYNVAARKFNLLARKATRWEQAHSSDLASFYRPVAVLRSDLPKGSIVQALRAMLPDKEIAAATALSIRRP